VTQNSASTTLATTPPTITINGNNPAIIQVSDKHADLGPIRTARNMTLLYPQRPDFAPLNAAARARG